MRREFLKNDDFQNPRLEKPVEFEIKDYDNAVKNSPFPQMAKENPKTEPGKPTQNPEIKQEPLEPLNETSKPQPTKIPRALRNLVRLPSRGYSMSKTDNWIHHKSH